MFDVGHVHLQQLQHLSHELRRQHPNHAALLRATLFTMRIVRECVNLDLAGEIETSEMAAKTSLYVSKLIQRCQDEAGLACPDRDTLCTMRQKRLQEELDAVETISRAPFHQPKECQHTLRNVIQHLRAKEATRAFHVSLLQCQKQLDSTYEASTFAYGSTPFSTWVDLFTMPPLVECIAEIRAKQSHASSCTVFGSSTGSLVFYTALLCGIPVRGIEILPFLVQVATTTESTFQVSHATFHCHDMLETDLQHVRLLILTSQCWEARLMKKVVEKLTKELPHTALVLDYTQSLGSLTDGAFELVHTAVGSVSWHAQHTMYLFRKIA
ncbi:Aste57867_11182 [Aphanomyces stellatus]|uniref:Aste57867_11182 protein n=1 Tax=Aphanomyces stellatus TaxID=120398 RepID=A0A485KSP0_9STRA|nr:hypothetical protein As57867_011140 [Aphanomyces stellatus]VFT88049.1 Aste57867_11182 [Aphanomyces stellatus]